ncbi:hypothetical protein QAD02_003451 [Eretmocerus hayati]|uniref:Uncharacterized protein n=1 Tax=Eretmocerus hayati TaxID=131215 RepID=A0ACC2NPM5_9HYME|nr:hypothetical protein QAD02_003451 [Eretmocerus hayati]
MQIRTSGKRKEQERSADRLTGKTAKKKFTEGKGDKERKEGKDEETRQKECDLGKNMEEMRAMLSNMHEDIKMGDRMIGRMGSMIREIKTGNDGRTEKIEKLIINLEVKDGGRAEYPAKDRRKTGTSRGELEYRRKQEGHTRGDANTEGNVMDRTKKKTRKEWKKGKKEQSNNYCRKTGASKTKGMSGAMAGEGLPGHLQDHEGMEDKKHQ